jgi:hypothetical protein
VIDNTPRDYAWAVALLNHVKDGGDATAADIDEALRLTGDLA